HGGAGAERDAVGEASLELEGARERVELAYTWIRLGTKAVALTDGRTRQGIPQVAQRGEVLDFREAGVSQHVGHARAQRKLLDGSIGDHGRELPHRKERLADLKALGTVLGQRQGRRVRNVGTKPHD